MWEAKQGRCYQEAKIESIFLFSHIRTSYIQENRNASLTKDRQCHLSWVER